MRSILGALFVYLCVLLLSDPCQPHLYKIFDIVVGTNKLQNSVVSRHLTTLLYGDWLPQVNGPVEGFRI